MNIKELFGLRIKEYRKKKGLTQSQLAENVSIDSKHISCIENGKNFPSADLIERLAKTLDVEPKEFFEFYHLQKSQNLKSDIISMLDDLTQEQLELIYKYTKSFVI
jgi:transcriptional regulator with XRE-family HTH domain